MFRALLSIGILLAVPTVVQAQELPFPGVMDKDGCFVCEYDCERWKLEEAKRYCLSEESIEQLHGAAGMSRRAILRFRPRTKEREARRYPGKFDKYGCFVCKYDCKKYALEEGKRYCDSALRPRRSTSFHGLPTHDRLPDGTRVTADEARKAKAQSTKLRDYRRPVSSSAATRAYRRLAVVPQRHKRGEFLLNSHTRSILRGLSLEEKITHGSAPKEEEEGEQAGGLRATSGDTFEVEWINKARDNVRLVGVRAPRPAARYRRAECYSGRSQDRLEALVTNRIVLHPVSGFEEADVYGRLLRYATLKDGSTLEGSDIGALMISEGYARSDERIDHPKRELYESLEREAREKERNLWSSHCKYRANFYAR